LLGAVTAERARLGAPRPPVWSAALVQVEAAIRADIGAAAFDHAFEDGFDVGLHRVAGLLVSTEGA
jgi:hypothetical protein